MPKKSTATQTKPSLPIVDEVQDGHNAAETEERHGHVGPRDDEMRRPGAYEVLQYQVSMELQNYQMLFLQVAILNLWSKIFHPKNPFQHIMWRSKTLLHLITSSLLWWMHNLCHKGSKNNPQEAQETYPQDCQFVSSCWEPIPWRHPNWTNLG